MLQILTANNKYSESDLKVPINKIGNTFLNLKEFMTVVERFVFSYDVHQVIEDSSTFAAECKSFFQFVPSLKESSPKEVKNFL